MALCKLGPRRHRGRCRGERARPVLDSSKFRHKSAVFCHRLYGGDALRPSLCVLHPRDAALSRIYTPGVVFHRFGAPPFCRRPNRRSRKPLGTCVFQIDFDTHELPLNDLAYVSLAYTLFYAVISIAVTCRGLAGRRLCDAIGQRGCDLFVQ